MEDCFWYTTILDEEHDEIDVYRAIACISQRSHSRHPPSDGWTPVVNEIDPAPTLSFSPRCGD